MTLVKNAVRRLSGLVQHIEDKPYHPARLLFVVLVVGIGRAVEEIYFGHARLAFNGISHFSAFYLATFFGFTGIAAILIRQDWKKSSQVVVLGILAGLAPPLIDLLWLGPGGFKYSYLDQFYPTFHGSGNPYSEAITAWTCLGAFALYIYLRGGSLWRALVGLVFGYLCLALMVSQSSAFFKEVLSPFRVGGARTFIFLFFSYGVYVVLNFRRFVPSLKRINHSLPWVVLVFLGASLAGGIQRMTWLQAGIVLLVHQGIVFANDYYDRDSDQLNQRVGLLDRNDIFVIHTLIVWLAFHMYLDIPKLGPLYLLYILFATAYHHPILRLKRIFPLNYGLEGVVAALALLIGMVSTGHFGLTGQEVIYVGLAFAGFSAASPFKDYKDIPGDRATGTQTLYVLLAKRGWSLAKAHGLISTVLLSCLTIPLVLLYLKGVSIPLVLLILVGLVVPIFFSLRRGSKRGVVERTVWLVIGYLIVLVVVLQFGIASPGQPLLKDYGEIEVGAANYSSAHPVSSQEVAEIIRKANREKTPIRVRGNGHSMNGASLPRANEAVIFTDRMRHYHFEEPGSITVDAGIRMYELRRFLKSRGYGLPVVNDGQGGPSVGGYLAGGGFGVGSRQHGGFWENVLEITLVTGAGEVLQLKPGDELFPWMFGSMGELGVVVSAKLKILTPEAVGSYPLDEQGILLASEVEATEHPYWFTIFVPKGELEAAKASLMRIEEAHPNVLKYRRIYVYPITFVHFHPKLLFPLNEDIAAVGIWGDPPSSDLPQLREGLMGLERDVMKLVVAHRDTPYRRYIQTEIVGDRAYYEANLGPEVYDEFLRLKRRLDPNFLLNCGMLIECQSQN